MVSWRRASVVLASAGGNTVPVIARLAATSRDRVREVIHRFNDEGMASLDPRWAGGRPRRITTDDEDFIVEAATTRPEALGLPFTRWSLRKLAAYLGDNQTRVVKISAERLRQILAARGVTFQRTKTWKESNDPERDAKLDRIEEVLGAFPQRCFAFDEFGPLTIRPVAGAGWALAGRPPLIAANYHKAHGVRQFHGCYSIGEDVLWGVVRQRKSAANTLAALKSIRARHSDGEWIYVILDNLSSHKPRRAPVGTRQQSRVVLHPDLQLLGQPDRSALRAAARVRAQQLPAPQPHSVDPSAARLPALAQRQRPRPRPARRATPRTRPNPSRERPPLGPTTPTSSMKHHRNDTRANVCGHRTSTRCSSRPSAPSVLWHQSVGRAGSPALFFSDGRYSEPGSTGAVRVLGLARPPERPPDVGECCW